MPTRLSPASPSRKWRHRLALLVLAVAVYIAQTGRTQVPGSGIPNPRLFTLAPNGGKAGSIVEVAFTGSDLEEPQSLLFSHPGIKAEPIIPPPPPPPDPKKPPAKPPAPTPITKFKVTISPDAPLGFHDVRFVNKWGVSNPRVFVVGEWNEVVEKEPNNDPPQAQRVEVNSTVFGTIAPNTDVDYFVFAGTKGKRVVVSCLASSIDSRLYPELRLFDSNQRQLASNRNYKDTDALVDVTLPADGDYYVRLCEFTHIFGSPEHFYRLTVTTAPWIDAVHPTMIEPGKTSQVTLLGRNLPGGTPDPNAVHDGRVLERLTVAVTAPTDPAALQRLAYTGRVAPTTSALDGFEYRLRTPAGTSNPVLLTYAAAPVVLDNEANDTPETAQEVAAPCEIAGRIEKRRDVDWYTFQAKKGEVHVIEAFCDRIGTQADLYFRVRNPTTKQDIGEFDDNTDTLSPSKFFTRTDDPAPYRFVAPADGKYQVMVTTRDATTRAGPNLLYRLRIVPEKPDFRLIVMPPADSRPDACCVRQNSQQFLFVFVWRRDGFNAPIDLAVEGLPPGVSCQPQSVAAGMRQAALVLSAAPTAAPWAGAIRVKGTATLAGQQVVREARPASLTWQVQPQQNIPALTRLDRQLFLAVRDNAPFQITGTPDKQAVPQGTKFNVALKLNPFWPDLKKQQFNITSLAPNPNLSVNNGQPFPMPPGKDALTVPVEAKSGLAPGTYTLVLRAQAQVPYNKDPMAKQKQPINVVQPSLPITFTVLPQALANLSVPNPNATLKLGMQAEVVVRAARLHEYAGEFKVQLVLPPNLKGISADEVVIPAGKDEVKFLVRATADATLGNHQNLVVRATGMYQGKVPTVQETKVNINVVK